MKRGLTIGLTIAALGATASLVTAGTWTGNGSVTTADAMPAYEILTTVRELGFEPSSQPLLNGPYYVLYALGPNGMEMRVVADAHSGYILSIVEAHPDYYVRRHPRGPRIIEVPQPGARGSGDLVEPPPPHHRRAKPRPKHDSEAPPPPAQHRPILSAPPPSPRAEGPSPIYPTPKYGAADRDHKIEAGEKFSSPDTGQPK